MLVNRYDECMTQIRRLQIVLVLNICMLFGLAIVGMSSHSLGVLAAGGDYLLDSSAIIFGLFAILVRNRNENRSNATNFAALLNVLMLLSVTIVVILEAVNRLLNHAPHIHALPVALVSFLAAGVMTIGAFILEGEDADLNMRSVWLDTVADAVSATAIGVTALVILISNNYFWADSVVAILISTAICYQAFKLLRDVVRDFARQ